MTKKPRRFCTATGPGGLRLHKDMVSPSSAYGVKMEQKKSREVIIPAGRAKLRAIFSLPSRTKGVVAFAHGSGSGRLSPRNNFVAQVLQEAGIATLLADLLEEGEALDRRNVFDIDLLADRLLANVQWLDQLPETHGVPFGYFGASTGAAAALLAATREPDGVTAVVSRGGRPDLAMDYLHLVRSPTLLIVGGEDRPVIPLNELAYKKLSGDGYCTRRNSPLRGTWCSGKSGGAGS